MKHVGLYKLAIVCLPLAHVRYKTKHKTNSDATFRQVAVTAFVLQCEDEWQ